MKGVVTAPFPFENDMDHATAPLPHFEDFVRTSTFMPRPAPAGPMDFLIQPRRAWHWAAIALLGTVCALPFWLGVATAWAVWPTLP